MNATQNNNANAIANTLRNEVLAIELHLPTLGRSRTLSVRHRSEVADHMGATREAVGANKRLYAANQPQIKAIASVLGDISRDWKELAITYRRGIRLMRRETLDVWIERFEKHNNALQEALANADAHYNEILQSSRESLGEKLFDLNDYPTRFTGSLPVSWGIHNFEPSQDLCRLAPEVYEREQQRVRAQFENAVAIFEQESREKLQKLVDALLEKLSDAAAGKKVTYTEAATSNLREFFERFKAIGVRSDDELNDLIESAQTALGSVTMFDLKKSEAKRDTLNKSFTKIADKLKTMIVDAPARAIDFDELD